MTTVDEPIEFELRPEDNERGNRWDSNGCPVAVALRRTFRNVKVGVKYVSINGSTWLIPQGLGDAIRAYDRTHTPIPPGRYTLTERPYAR